MATLLYFGTFNPIHTGHLTLASIAQKAGNFQQVLFIPAFAPPNKTDTLNTLYPYATRIALLQAALTAWGNPAFRISEIEQTLASQHPTQQPIFTATVLEALLHTPLQALNAQSLPFVMGADTFASLPYWHHWQELARVGHFWVAQRPQVLQTPFPVEQLPWVQQHHVAITPLPMKPLAISASLVRRAIAQADWDTVAQCVPPAMLPLLQALPTRQIIA